MKTCWLLFFVSSNVQFMVLSGDSVVISFPFLPFSSMECEYNLRFPFPILVVLHK